jgi:hypothetical protein
MTDTLEWTTTRAETIELFAGQTPRAQDETRIIPLWQHSPAAYTAAAQDVAHALHAGIVTWGWSTLASRLERAHTPARQASAATGPDRDRAISRAEQWVRAAGIHYDRWPEVEDDLFGDTGLLRTWHSDDRLRQRIRSLWETERPRGEHVEHEAEESAARYRTHQAAAAERAQTRKAELDQQQAHPLPSGATT